MVRLINRTRLVAFAFLALVGVLVFLIYCPSKEEVYRPTYPDYLKIEFEMTPSEVEAILGPPHEVLTSESRPRARGSGDFHKPKKAGERVFIYFGAPDADKTLYEYHVVLDTEGRVYGHGFGTTSPELTAFERAIKWLQDLFGL
jgi:hypothetical protein